jgi:phage-related protein
MSRRELDIKLERSKYAREVYYALEETIQHQVKRSYDMLSARGIAGATMPLVSHFEQDIYYIRSKHEQTWIRSFYYRDDEHSVLIFYIYEKDSDRIPGKVRKAILAEYERTRERQEERNRNHKKREKDSGR